MSYDPQWYFIPVNPEPWAIGSLDLGRRNGKMFPKIGPNPQLVAYQEAIREYLKSENVEVLEGPYDILFFFYRRLDDYETKSGKRHRKHVADATNLQKATEDALQGVLIGNDRDVHGVRSRIERQGPDVEGCIVVRIQQFDPLDYPQSPEWINQKVIEHQTGARIPTLFDNSSELAAEDWF